MNNIIGRIEYGVRGDKALFVTPESKYNANPVSYEVPTFGSLRSLTGSIYRHKHPFDFDWRIDKIRVMNKIGFESILNSFYMNYNSSLVEHTYLKNVYYQVLGNISFKDGCSFRCDESHLNAAVKAEQSFIKRLKKHNYHSHPFLGRAECIAYPKMEEFGSGIGYYDNVDKVELGNMFIQFEYLDDNPYGKRKAYFANIVMRNGIIELPKKEDCEVILFK